MYRAASYSGSQGGAVHKEEGTEDSVWEICPDLKVKYQERSGRQAPGVREEQA